MVASDQRHALTHSCSRISPAHSPTHSPKETMTTTTQDFSVRTTVYSEDLEAGGVRSALFR